MSRHAPDTLSLVADVGGTNTRVALAEGAQLKKDTVRKFSNKDYAGLGAVLSAFVEEEEVDCAGAAVAIAGPVRDGRGTLTNLDWSVDPDMLSRVTGAETVAVLNDLQAQGHAMGRIAPEYLRPVVDGQSVEGGTRLVIGVGTGFNAAVVLDTPLGRIVPPSEAGHANMPLRTEEELRLCKFVETSHGFPSVEDVLSGRGLEHRQCRGRSGRAGRDPLVRPHPWDRRRQPEPDPPALRRRVADRRCQPGDVSLFRTLRVFPRVPRQGPVRGVHEQLPR